jgi:ribosomal protein S18 acetylase RimI-like enzyme
VKLADSSVRIEPLSPVHNRAAFDCGNDGLNRYIREQATQDTRRGVARIFVAVVPDDLERIAGFFSLSAASVIASDLPPEVAKRLPRHPIPAALVGRLAVDNSFGRRGLGGILVADTIKKAMAAAETVAMTVVVVDPINDAARAFYSAFGFRGLQGPQAHMFLILPRHANRSGVHPRRIS